MSRVNYRTIIDRFSHIDADFVNCRCELDGGESFYRVRFYPWWKHPGFIEAMEKGNKWGFSDTENNA
jgi:hypothetical protein